MNSANRCMLKINRLVARQDHHSVLAQVSIQSGFNILHSGSIDSAQRFIQYPEQGTGQVKTGNCHPAPLTGR